VTTMSLNIMMQVGQLSSRPYRIIETYLTSEGPRTRVCSGAFSTQEDAQIWLEQLQVGLPNGEAA
jgi:hypothetical protein